MVNSRIIGRLVRRLSTLIEAVANQWGTVFPFVHHDISDLPTQHQLVTKLLYYQWLALAVTLIINLLGAIFLLVAGSSEGG